MIHIAMQIGAAIPSSPLELITSSTTPTKVVLSVLVILSLVSWTIMVAKAIEFKAGKGEFTWSYDPAQCTFCGRCVEGCIDHALKEGHTEHALTQDSACPPVYLNEGELKVSFTVARKKSAAPQAKPAPAVTPATSSNPVPGGPQ